MATDTLSIHLSCQYTETTGRLYPAAPWMVLNRLVVKSCLQ